MTAITPKALSIPCARACDKVARFMGVKVKRSYRPGEA